MKATPAGPRGDWLMGSIKPYTENPLCFLEECARDYGDFVPFRLGNFFCLLVNGPDLIHEVLVTASDSFSKDMALRNNRRFFGNGLLVSEGDFWKRQRKLASPAFSPKQMESYGDLIVEHAERMVSRWQDGNIIDVQSEMVKVSLGVVVKALFDADIQDPTGAIASSLTEVQELLDRRMNSPWLLMLPEWVPFPTNLRMTKALQPLESLIRQIIDERRSNSGARGDLLAMLMGAVDEDTGARMSDRQIRDELLTLFFAGHETTALTLTWCLYLLSQNPAVEAELRAELARVLGGRTPGVSDLFLLPFTEKVIKESMRVYPPVWVIGREAMRDCTIGGYPVPKGTSVMMSQWVSHRDRRFFADPERFDPQRWTDEFTRSLPKFSYYPFGGGPRVCIGNSFAMIESMMVLAAIVQRCRLELSGEADVEPHPMVTLRPDRPVKMHVRLRGDGKTT